MKIQSTGAARAAGTKRTDKAKSAGDGSFSKLLATGEAADGVQAAAPTHSVDALLAAQEVPTDADAAHGRARQRAATLLDRLEEIRDGLLFGAISKSRLQDLARMVKEKRETMADPRLGELLDEIELRVRIELAKLRVDS